MKSNELLNNFCKCLQETVTSQWSNIKLISKENTIEYFESKDQGENIFIGSDNSHYPKDTKVWGIEIFADERCVFRFYDIFEQNENATNAEERITYKAISEICYRFIEDRIDQSKSFIIC